MHMTHHTSGHTELLCSQCPHLPCLQLLSPFQLANIVVQTYPWVPDTNELLNMVARELHEPSADDLFGLSATKPSASARASPDAADRMHTVEHSSDNQAATNFLSGQVLLQSTLLAGCLLYTGGGFGWAGGHILHSTAERFTVFWKSEECSWLSMLMRSVLPMLQCSLSHSSCVPPQQRCVALRAEPGLQPGPQQHPPACSSSSRSCC